MLGVGNSSHGQLPGADHVDVEDLAPDLGGGGLEVDVAHHLRRPGVVDEGIYPPVALEDGIDHGADLFAVGDVDMHVIGSCQASGEGLTCLDRTS
jgi:hypothetical protein